ncbi:NADH-quinone oxidoreductase subunit NuoK [Xanthocytophaga agilis]|uniref:NADH-quinone oxidoreductase subunit K n=1 Tax=Xanthocytophaga agilis TaxID=3048010 RepID=A0AAE3UHB9_9BACT|nr:NADH-quinone oxidoreductase subunit NuoK [Xanthocytophaga agilis]MDJ1504181.1 NADH-quinone oxidoreductase subunit NuoK [Xanthocytophaga agilis]
MSESVIPVTHFLFVGAILFCIGIALIITKRNAIVVLMGIELILNSANLNFVVFNRQYPENVQGQVFALFVIVVAAAEAAVALAIVLKVYQYFGTINLDEVKDSKKD